MSRPRLNNYNVDFFLGWSSGMAWVLGLAFADGCVLDHKEDHIAGLDFTSIDPQLVSLVADLAMFDGPVYERHPKRQGRQATYSIVISDKQLPRILAGYGLHSHKSYTMRMPDVPIVYLWDFVRGYFDGDGCVGCYDYPYQARPRGKVVFASASCGFLRDVASCLCQEGLRCAQPSLHRPSGTFQLQYGARRDILALYNGMYNVSGCPCLVRKRDRFLKCIKTLEATK